MDSGIDNFMQLRGACKDKLQKKRVFVCNRMDETELGKVFKVIKYQSSIGIAFTFDLKNLEAGLQNLSYIVICTSDPFPMTYVFDCVSLDPVDLLVDLKAVLTNPLITKVVNDVYSSVYYLYHQHFMEVQNIMDIQIIHRSLVQSRKKTPIEVSKAQTSLEDLIRLYIDPLFAWPEQTTEEMNSKDLWNNSDSAQEAHLAHAALQGMFLLDIFQAQQQVFLASSVHRLGSEAREKLLVHSVVSFLVSNETYHTTVSLSFADLVKQSCGFICSATGFFLKFHPTFRVATHPKFHFTYGFEFEK